MSSDVSIRVDGLSKCYQIYDKPSDRLKETVIPSVRGLLGLAPTKYHRDFWALRDVSFEVHPGETIGVIGKNGSGKSTLLQLICGTLNPTAGEVFARGRVAALLELGSGFNPEFSGVENIYLNGEILGLTREEITQKFDSIVAFADIGDHLHQPVKSYSSGMFVRLAFAVQACVDPDVLIVDEALAVGDARFQAKCFDRLKQLKEKGCSILLVTHSHEQVIMHCDRAVLLNGGRMLQQGAPKLVVNRYLDLLFGRGNKDGASEAAVAAEASSRSVGEVDAPVECESVVDAGEQVVGLSLLEDRFSIHPNYNEHEYRWGDGAAKILDFELEADGARYPLHVQSGQQIRLSVAVRFLSAVNEPIIGVTVKTKEGLAVFGTNSELVGMRTPSSVGEPDSSAVFETRFDAALAGGDYFVSVGIASRINGEVVPHDRRYDSVHFSVAPTAAFQGLVDLHASMDCR